MFDKEELVILSLEEFAHIFRGKVVKNLEEFAFFVRELGLKKEVKLKNVWNFKN